MGRGKETVTVQPVQGYGCDNAGENNLFRSKKYQNIQLGKRINKKNKYIKSGYM
jgi:hypothetical protein